ncbi:MAG: hypothetical protein JXR96_21415 [Deltaproteobacteria bacterium]|nr:hypothetical protein [Deltaproteobacteria bacterium]
MYRSILSNAWLVAAACLLAAGCKEEGQPRQRLVSEAEMDALKQDIQKTVERNRSRKCPRAVLRGEPLDGPAADDILAVVEGAADTRACLNELKEHNDLLDEAHSYPRGQVPTGFPYRLNRTAKPQPEAPEQLLALERACEPIVQRIQKATRHPDACSPFLPGLRGQPSLISAVRAMRVASVKARRLVAKGETEQGFELLLDVVRFSQDLCRGGASLLETMVAATGVASALAVLEHSLNRPEPIDAARLAQIDDELAALIVTHVHPAEYLRGEVEAMSIEYLADDRRARGKQGEHPALKTAGVDVRDDIALSHMAMHELGEEVLSGCKPSDPPIRCTGHIRKLAARYAENKEDHETVKTLLKSALSKDKTIPIRRRIIDILKSMAAPAHDRYLVRDGQIRFQLAALRLHAAYRRLAESSKTCPELAAFDAPPLSERRTDPYSGEAVRIEQLGPGKFVLRSPVPLGKQGGENAEPAMFIDCPYR